jgi:transcriptional regulator with XRE-family HTH domain
MINYERLKARRKELGLSQGELAERVTKLSKQGFSQQAVAFVENGTTRRPKLLPYICQALELKLSDVDQRMESGMDSDLEDIFSRVRQLPHSEQLAIAHQILTDLNNP